MAVGDDVVDLGDPAIAASHLGERYARRVLTASELERWRRSDTPKNLLWGLFAAKEAAYKAVGQVRPAPGFAHRRFEVAPDFSSVTFQDLCLSARLETSAEWVHAIAWLGREPELSQVRWLAQDENPSNAARRELCLALARARGVRAEELAVVRDARPGSWDGFGPPRVEHLGRAVEAQVSLSHDGRFVSFAAQEAPPG
jgi:phosphopantetheine--protein transferase-like protein